MKLRYLWAPLLIVLAVYVTGCGSIPVEAVAPGRAEDRTATTDAGGQFVLYRATGLDHAPGPFYERLWVVTAPRGTRIGFNWVIDPQHRYDDFGGYHLQAFVGGEVRDLGPFNTYDAKYIWAGADTDLNGYFRHNNEQKLAQVLTLQ